MKYDNEWKDYISFLKKNLKLIVSVTVLVIILIVGTAAIYRATSEVKTVDEEVQNEQKIQQKEILNSILKNEIEYETLSENEISELETYLNQEAQTFRVVIEKEDFTVFRDARFLNSYLVQDSIVNNIVSKLETPIEELPGLFIKVEETKDTTSMLLKFGTSNVRDNQILAQYYYDFLNENSSEFFNNKNVIFLESAPTELESSENEEVIVNDVPEENVNSQTPLFELIIIISVVGLVLGVFLGISIAAVKVMFSDKLPSIYNLSNLNIKNVLRLDLIKSANIESIKKMLSNQLTESSSSTLLLTETNLSIPHHFFSNRSGINEHTIYYLNTVEDLTIEKFPSNTIILVEFYNSSKGWLQKEIEQLKGYKTNVTIIVLPKGIL